MRGESVVQAVTAAGTRPLHEPWQAVSTLVSEYGHAVQHILDNDSGLGTGGNVQYERKASNVLSNSRSLNREVDRLGQSHSCSPLVNQQGSHAQTADQISPASPDVEAEITRVTNKLYKPDVAKTVHLRFDYMTERSSRVGILCNLPLPPIKVFKRLVFQVALLCVAASVLLGTGALIAEFTKKLQLVIPPV